MSDETMEARGVFAAVCGVAGAAGSTTGTELTPAAEIRAYVDKVWPSFLDDLEALVVVPSVVDESRAWRAPVGPGMSSGALRCDGCGAPPGAFDR